MGNRWRMFRLAGTEVDVQLDDYFHDCAAMKKMRMGRNHCDITERYHLFAVFLLLASVAYSEDKNAVESRGVFLALSSARWKRHARGPPIGSLANALRGYLTLVLIDCFVRLR